MLHRAQYICRHVFSLVAVVVLLLGFSAQSQTLPPKAPPTIVFMTDFGTGDDSVAICKGVMYAIAPDTRIVDLTQQVPPFSILDGARYLYGASPYYPAGTVFIAVVDPGVGSARKAMVVKSKRGQYFVLPDNGLITLVEDRDGIEGVREITNRDWMIGSALSSTFHGRDIFSPVAAHLARGVPLSSLGPRLARLTEADLEQPTGGRTGGLDGRIIHVDHFGNCITNITPGHLEQAGLDEHLTVRIIDQQISGLHRTFADVPVGALIALIGSNNRLELAVRNGNAAQSLGVGIGDTVRVRSAHQEE